MTRSLKSMNVVAAALSLLSLGACHSAFNGQKDAWSVESAHPITVQTHLVSGEIHVAQGSTQLSDDDRDQIARLAADYSNRGSGKLVIASPDGSGVEQSSMQMAAQMTNIALDQGVDAGNVEISSYHPAAGQADAPIVVSYSVYKATASACGNWTKNYAYAPLNHDTPDHGCATQNNLAAMVENPRDLIAARDEQPADQTRRATVLDQYRKGLITASQKDDQAAGTVSEMNK